MYFVDPNIICAGGRTQDMFDTQGTGDRLIIQVQNDHINMIISLRLILEGWRYSHWQPRDSSPEQGGGRGWSRMVQSLLLYRDGGSLHPIWLHSRAGLSTDPASSGSWISCFFLPLFMSHPTFDSFCLTMAMTELSADLSGNTLSWSMA